MKNRSVFLIAMVFLIPSLLLLAGEAGGAVSAVSNESVIEGVVSEYTIISSSLVDIKPEQVIYRLNIKITLSHSTGEGPDLLFNMIGHDVHFFSKQVLSPELYGKRIKAKARYKGDERGRSCWISDIEVIK